jgi:hypothetical protein
MVLELSSSEPFLLLIWSYEEMEEITGLKVDQVRTQMIVTVFTRSLLNQMNQIHILRP